MAVEVSGIAADSLGARRIGSLNYEILRSASLGTITARCPSDIVGRTDPSPW